MCGRFTITQLPDALDNPFGVEIPDAVRIDFHPRYNVAPTQPILAVRARPDNERREPVRLRWGMIPSWAKDPAIGNRMINARAESVADKPAFRAALRRRRCLILADGFYEWQRRGRSKQPYYFRLKGGGLFAFAGLWEHWQSPGGEEIQSCTMLTTTANDLCRTVHVRMPLILKPESYDPWLDPAVQTSKPLAPLMVPFPENLMECHPVSTRVNNPANDGPENVEPLNDLFPMND